MAADTGCCDCAHPGIRPGNAGENTKVLLIDNELTCLTHALKFKSYLRWEGSAMSLVASVKAPVYRFEGQNELNRGFGTWDWHLADNLLFADEYVANLFCVDPDMAKKGLPPEMFLSRIIPEDRFEVEKSIALSISLTSSCFNQFRIMTSNGKIKRICTRGKSFGSSADRAEFIVGLAMCLEPAEMQDVAPDDKLADNQKVIDLLHLCAIAKSIAATGDLDVVNYLLDMISLDLNAKFAQENSSRH